MKLLNTLTLGITIFLFVTSAYSASNCPLQKSSSSSLATVKAALKVGQERFKETCAMCHATGMASPNTPIPHKIATWIPFIKAACKKDSTAKICSNKDLKNLDASKLLEASCLLLPFALEGKKGTAMMARGGCAKCTDKDLQSVLVFMLSEKK